MKKKSLNNDFHQLQKYIKYLFFGFLTTILNAVIFSLCVWLNIYYLLSNSLAFIIAVIFAYLTNKRWVFFESNSNKISFHEFFRFAASRISTFILESIILFLFITLMGFNQYGVKLVATLIVVITNYFLSEFIVFKKQETFEEV